MQVRELLEGKRDKSLDYQTVLKGKAGEIDKVVVKLDGAKSSSFTKLAKEYKELQVQSNELKTKLATNQDRLRENMEALFDPADEVLTRVVETCSLTLQLAKAVQPSSKTEVNYEKAFNALVQKMEELVPELKDKMKDIVACATKAAEETKNSAGKKSAFTVKEGLMGDFMMILKALRNRLAKWFTKYDKKLQDVRQEMTRLEAMQSRIDRKLVRARAKA